MKITEQVNKDMAVGKVNMSCDQKIMDNKGRSVCYPLMQTSFLYLISGPSGSGKSNLLVNLLTKSGTSECKKNMKSYRSMFDNIIMVSPSAHTIQNKLMDTIPSEQRYDSLTEDVFDKVEQLTEDAVEEDVHTLLVLDDVSSELRKKEVESELNKIVKNRRHINLSLIIISHKITDYGTALRNNANLIFIFRPKSKREYDMITTEFMMRPVNECKQIIDHIYQGKHDFMLIDQSLRDSSHFSFHRNYDKLLIDD